MESDCVTINKIDSYAINFIFVYLLEFQFQTYLYADWHLADTHSYILTRLLASSRFVRLSLLFCPNTHSRIFILMVNYVFRHLFVSVAQVNSMTRERATIAPEIYGCLTKKV